MKIVAGEGNKDAIFLTPLPPHPSGPLIPGHHHKGSRSTLATFDLPKMFCCLFCYLCCVLLLLGTLCLYNLLLLVRLVVAVFVSACTVTLFLLFVSLLLPLLGRRPLKNPQLPLLTFPQMSRAIFEKLVRPFDLAKSQQPIVVKIHQYLKKVWKNRNSTRRHQ